jgi:type I restriction enzyme S subunit
MSEKLIGSKKIPHGWVWATLDEIALFNPPTPDGKIDDTSRVSFVPMKDVEELKGTINLSSVRIYKDVKGKYTPFVNGDIIFAKITPCMENGKIAIAENLENGIGFGSTEFHVIRLANESVPRFFLYYLLRQKFRTDAQRSMTGSAGQLRVPIEFIKKSVIPIPPLAEQCRILSRIEEIICKLDMASKYLEQSLKLVEQYRRSVLDYAFKGKLTEKWRLKNIKRVNTVSPFPISKNQSLVENLPKGWIVAELGVMLHGARYGTSKKCWKDAIGIPVLRIPNVVNGSISLNDLKYTTLSRDELDTLSLKYGDIIVIRTNGSLNYVGRSACIDEIDGSYAFASYLIRLRLINPELAPYISLYLESDYARTFIEKNARSTAGQYNINLPIVRSIPIILPSLPEQQAISDEIRYLFTIFQGIRHNIAIATMKIYTLKQSILNYAFDGKLIPQDPNDEPAEILLKRMKEEKQSISKGGKPRNVSEKSIKYGNQLKLG